MSASNAISIVERPNARLLNIAIPIAIFAASLRWPILARPSPPFAATKHCRSQAKSIGRAAVRLPRGCDRCRDCAEYIGRSDAAHLVIGGLRVVDRIRNGLLIAERRKLDGVPEHDFGMRIGRDGAVLRSADGRKPDIALD